MNNGFSSILNFSRWFAALLVLIHHVRHLVFADLKDVQNISFFTKLFYFFSGLGHEAVIVFFVVSGLLVGALTLEKWRNGLVNEFSDYFIHRFSRIYIVLFPALLVGFLMDYYGLIFFDGSCLYSNSAQYHTISLDSVIKDNLGVVTFLGNLAMFQNIHVGVLGSNGPLWSLANEWWYYCLWALFIRLYFLKGGRKIFSGLILVVIFAFLSIKVLLWMLVWMLGVGVYYYGRSSLPRPHPILGFSIFLVAIIASRLSVHAVESFNGVSKLYLDFFRDFCLALAYSLALVSAYKLTKPIWLEKIHLNLASFSYSLYLVHFPAMLLIVAVVKEKLGIGFLLQPTYGTYFYYICIVIFLYGYGYLFSLFTEKHTYKLVGFLRAIFLVKK